MAINPAMFSSDRPDWQTPPALVERIRAFGRGRIGLDPSTDWTNPCGAQSIYVAPPDSPATIPAIQRVGVTGYDGLANPWRGCGLVYCNPPYGRGIGDWTAKAHEFVPAPCDGDELIMLLPARPDTAYWHRDVVTASAVLFMRGRLRFVGAPSAAPFPSVLAYWGGRPKQFGMHFGGLGWVVYPSEAPHHVVPVPAATAGLSDRDGGGR